MLAFNGLFAQDLSLEISFNDKNAINLLDKIKYHKKNHDSISIDVEITKISNYLKTKGYFTHVLDSTIKDNKKVRAYFTLYNKVDNVIIKVKKDYHFLFENIKSDSLYMKIENLQNLLSETSEKLEKLGKSFSKVRLKNISVQKKILIADLEIYQSKKRYLNKVIIKGYTNFPKSYLKNHFKINTKTIFNQSKIKEISNAAQSLNFIKVIKPPEILFTKDSTLLYLYLKKIQNNSFDGIINFTSRENGEILFTGNVDLKLNNTLNKGEKFELFWNSISEQSQEFRLLTEAPYLFNSRLTPKLSFTIYKQDSIFLNTKFNAELFYNFNPKSKIALNFSSESSDALQSEITNDIISYNNYFYGINYSYNIPKNDYFLNDKFNFEITPNIGKRRTDQELLNQFKVVASTTYFWDINSRSSVYLKNKSGYLNSDTYLTNELFRIGGPKSIRGFSEQSIFTRKFTYFNLEYRFLTNNKSYLYTVTDYGNMNNTNFIGLGLGYRFIKNKSIININSVLGNNNNSFSLSKIQLNVNYVTFF